MSPDDFGLLVSSVDLSSSGSLTWELPFAGAVLDVVPTAVVVVSLPDYRIVLANRRFLDLVADSASPATVRGRPIVTLAPPDLQSQLRQALDSAALSDAGPTVEDGVVEGGETGGTRHWRYTIAAIPGARGRAAALALTVEERTAEVAGRAEQVRLAERLRAANEQLTIANARLEAIVGELPQGIIVVGPGSRVEFRNPAAERLLGVSLPLGSPLYSLGVARYKRDGSAYELDELPLPRSLRGETCYGVEIQVRQSNGEVVETLCSSAPLYDAHDQVVAAVSIFQDISELREVDRLREEFFSIASHELKNPLSILKGYAQVLRGSMSGETQPRERQILGIIDREVNRLSRLINVMLDVSRIELGTFQLEPRETDLVELVRKLVDQYQGVSPRHTFAFSSSVPAASGSWDSTRIEEVFANLVDNALKYSPRGGQVGLGIEVHDQEVVASVRDEGIGIADEDRPRVFEKFYRSSSKASQVVAGMGVGLYVCSEIVRGHGGRLWVESQPGQGSVFYVALPLAVSE